MKNRLIYSGCQLAMILLNLIYCLLLLLLFPFMFIGYIFWKKETFWKMSNWYIKAIQEIPDIENDL